MNDAESVTERIDALSLEVGVGLLRGMTVPFEASNLYCMCANYSTFAFVACQRRVSWLSCTLADLSFMSNRLFYPCSVLNL